MEISSLHPHLSWLTLMSWMQTAAVGFLCGAWGLLNQLGHFDAYVATTGIGDRGVAAAFRMKAIEAMGSRNLHVLGGVLAMNELLKGWLAGASELEVFSRQAIVVTASR